MEANVKLWHMIVAAIGLLIACGTMVYKSGSNDATQDIKIDFLQKQLAELKVDMMVNSKKSEDRDERIMNILQDIQLTLKDKQDKKK